MFSLNNEKDLAEFTQLCQEVGLKTIGDLDRFTKETAGEPGNILDKLRVYRKELGSDFQIKESLYNFTEEEMVEYNMDEDGISLDSYDEYVRCNWCGEVFTVDQCIFEANMGWLCDRCYSAIASRGEKLTIIKNPTDEDITKTLTENVKMSTQELRDKFGTDDVDLINTGRDEEWVELDESAIGAAVASGVILDVVKRIFDKVGAHKKKSKWIDFRKYIIEKDPEGKINIWNLDGEQIASDMKTVKAAKEKIKTLPKPKKVKTTAEPKKEEEKSEVEDNNEN
jgi:hypothetical protein